jgi:putative ABC transport system permease protein
METMVQDVRYGFRMLRKSSGFTLVALLVLMVGIGANVAIFSVVDTILLRPLPFREANNLVAVWQNYPTLGAEWLWTSPPEYLDYKNRNRVFTSVAGFENDSANLTGGGEPERLTLARVTANLFPTLGVNPLLGRTFSESEEHIGADNVAVISYSFWRRRFGADPGVLGRGIKLDQKSYTVVGVMPGSFQFPVPGTPFTERAELWVPLAFTAHDLQARAESLDVMAVGRLKDGVTLQQAQDDVKRIATEFQRENPNVYNGKIYLITSLRPLASDVVGKVRPMLLVLMAAVGFVLLIACANIANLLLARSTARARETAIRSAIGASGSRLVRQFLTESVLLSGGGGVLGLLAAYWIVRLIAAVGPSQVPRLSELSIHPTALIFTLSVSLITGLLFGIAPAVRLASLNLNSALKEGASQTGTGRRHHRLANTLVVVEMGCSLLLLVGAGLLINSFIRVLRVPPGFNPEGVLVARTSFDKGHYPDREKRMAVEHEIMARIARMPGVQSAALASHLPLVDDRAIGVHAEGADPTDFRWAQNDLIDENYLRVMGIPLLQGRSFTQGDTPSTPPVAVINQSMARQYWPGQNAVGKHFDWGPHPPFTVIGVAADVKISALDADAPATAYMSLYQIQSGASSRAVFIVRSAMDAGSLATAIRREVWSVDKELPLYDIRTMGEIVATSVAQRRFAVLLLGSFAGLALMLAAIGLYGVLSYSVIERTREMGLRMALGARPIDLLRLVVGQGVRLAAVGVGAGLIASLILTRLISNLLFGVSPLDPITFLAVAGVLLVVAFLATYIPAHRAASVDPMVALRYE